MAKVERGRFSDGHDGPVVVFLIGMRINAWWRVRRWLPVARAMGPMVRELLQDPASGLLGVRYAVGPGGPLLVQYWRDLDSLIGYAQDADRHHRPAWKDFNSKARDASAAVGIWHETYHVARGAHETLYVDMPASGLAAATSLVPAERRGHAARERLAVDRQA